MKDELRPRRGRTRAGGITRRDLLHRMAVAAGALSASPFAAACGFGGGEPRDGRLDGAPKGPDYTTTEVVGFLNVANRPRYIDTVDGDHPTIDDFENATGIQVNYQEAVEDEDVFLSMLRAELSSEEPTQWDLFVARDWRISRMARLGYLEELEHSVLPVFQRYAGEIYKDPPYDRRNAHSVPWQSGITAIAYRPRKTRRRLESFEDLFDPAFAGRVGMLAEMRETMSLTLLALGIDPQRASLEDAERARDKLLEQRDAEVALAYYDGDDYVEALAAGDLWVTMARSPDIFRMQSAYPEIEFIVPNEGGIVWVDAMAIPQDAAHPIDALRFMNFVYDPKIAAQIAASLSHTCPVPDARRLLADADERRAQRVGDSPLVFPTPAMEARLHYYKMLDEEEERAWDELFDEVVLG